MEGCAYYNDRPVLALKEIETRVYRISSRVEELEKTARHIPEEAEKWCRNWLPLQWHMIKIQPTQRFIDDFFCHRLPSKEQRLNKVTS